LTAAPGLAVRRQRRTSFGQFWIGDTEFNRAIGVRRIG
jgi:hypothetical protein